MEKFIFINGKSISVTEEVYYTYHKMRRYEKTLTEKDARNQVAHYDAWNVSFFNCLPLSGIPVEALEDTVIRKQTLKKLYRCLALLPEVERDLIHALFFEEQTVTALSKQLKIPARTLGCRRDRILEKLQKMMMSASLEED